MTNPPLAELYAAHTGKVSDKWSSYLPTYDRLFAHLRNRPISLLEIGVQNGGSLEIWAKYFPHPNALIAGVDINPECLKLSYSDKRIWIVQGDATLPMAGLNGQYDIIIDDGSHKPSEQIRAFELWFPRLVDGGIYVIEDLHCNDCDISVDTITSLFTRPLAIDQQVKCDDIARIEVLNSMIVLVKGDGSLGPRIVAGQDESICPVLHLNGEVRRG